MYNLIASALVPVFFVMALGYFAGKRRLVDNVNIKSLNVFLMMFTLPAALFTAIAQTPRTVIIQNIPLVAVLAISLLVVYGIIVLLEYKVFRLGEADGAVQTLTVAFPNFASIGIPLLVGIYGAQAALPVAVAIATGSVTISPLTLTLLEMSRNKNPDASKIAQFFRALKISTTKPIFLAPLLAVIFVLAGIHLPAIAGKSLNLIGQATAGTGLFLTGLILSAQPIRITGNVTLGVVFKNILQPLLAAGVVRLLHVPQPMASQVILLICIPAGFFGLVFGAGYDSRPAVAGSTLVASSLCGIVSLAVAIALVAPH